ncbi:hypothetical protein STCU_00141 [Strigomonas culicis]|nr:hypothetical protein STCU_00141 [Strigomonas culicis]|eukprot:EPY37156.1 hypothetical protein STCU_00141 [Strigomonas culicis]
MPVLHDARNEVERLLVDAIPRFRKMIAKARETNPNMQIYNESMCKKIEHLFTAFCVVFCKVLNGSESEELVEALRVTLLDADSPIELDESPLFRQFDELYNAFVVQRAQAEEWHTRVAGALTDIVQFEREGRELVQAQEQQGRKQCVCETQQHYSEVVERLRVQAEAKWKQETDRRGAEHARLITASRAVAATGLSSFIETQVPHALQRRFVENMFHLVRALRTTPEDVHIRRLRNNNQQLMAHYGHPCLCLGEGRECLCAAVVAAAEVVWYRFGYVVRYTNTTVPSLQNQIEVHALEDVTLPCSHSVSAHQYQNMGFEDYGERLFELDEPDAMKDSDRWMIWYEEMQHMQQELEMYSA